MPATAVFRACVLAAALPLLAACNPRDPGSRAVGGSLLGAGAGVAGLSGGDPALGALVGAGVGAVVGADAAPGRAPHRGRHGHGRGHRRHWF